MMIKLTHKVLDDIIHTIETDEYPSWMGGVYLGIIITAIITAGLLF